MSLRNMLSRIFGEAQSTERDPLAQAALTTRDPLPEKGKTDLDFVLRGGSSFDPVTGIVIPVPRIHMDTLRNGSQVTEYQYAFYLNDRMAWRLGFWGRDTRVDATGPTESISTFDLAHDGLIASILQFNRALGFDVDSLTFLRGLCRGMLLAYAGTPDSEETRRYRAVTTIAALAAAGVPLPSSYPTSPMGGVLLAELLSARDTTGGLRA